MIESDLNPRGVYLEAGSGELTLYGPLWWAAAFLLALMMWVLLPVTIAVLVVAGLALLVKMLFKPSH